jgi:hypothetical protein
MNAVTRAAALAQTARHGGTVGGGAGQLLNQVSQAENPGTGTVNPLGPAGDPSVVSVASRVSTTDG